MENENSVCFISKVGITLDIIGADKIELVSVNGWSSVSQKGIHKTGDLVLCLTTDAVIPQELCDIFGLVSYLRKGNRVRTVKLRGVYSECILIPVGALTEGAYMEGDDLTDILEIYKYEPPIKVVMDAGGKKHKYSDNPNFYIYYKFPNQKNVPNMFNEHDDVVITRKLHGANARYSIIKKHKITIIDRVKKLFGNKWAYYEYSYGSHNSQKGSDSQGFYSTDIWKSIAEKYEIKENLWKYVKSLSETNYIGSGIIIYGEIYGPGIQGNHYHYNQPEPMFAGFDVQIDGEYQDAFNETSYLEELKLPQVELLYTGKWSKEEQEKHVGVLITNTKTPHEGIVVKCISGNRRKVSKVINKDYLIFGEKNNIEEQGH